MTWSGCLGLSAGGTWPAARVKLNTNDARATQPHLGNRMQIPPCQLIALESGVGLAAPAAGAAAVLPAFKINHERPNPIACCRRSSGKGRLLPYCCARRLAKPHFPFNICSITVQRGHMENQELSYSLNPLAQERVARRQFLRRAGVFGLGAAAATLTFGSGKALADDTDSPAETAQEAAQGKDTVAEIFTAALVAEDLPSTCLYNG